MSEIMDDEKLGALYSTFRNAANKHEHPYRQTGESSEVVRLEGELLGLGAVAAQTLRDLAQRHEEAMPAQARASSWMTFNQFVDMLRAEADSIAACGNRAQDD